MDWLEQIRELEMNINLKSYFENKSLLEFVENHIQLDYFLNTLYIENKHPLIEKLKNLEKKTENETIKELLNIIKLQVKIPVKEQNFIKELDNSFNSHPVINNIKQNLQLLQQNFSGSSSKKGQVTEDILFNNLTNLFSDSEVINTSSISNSGDIQIKKDNKPMILIDSKNFKSNVPKIDIEKFYRDTELNNSCGILCSSNSGISNRQNLEIDIKDKNIYVFISNHQYDNTLFKLAIDIIYNIYDIIKDKCTDNIEVSKELFQRLKIEYNFFLTTFKQYIDNIKINIISIEKLAFNQLDEFFKRSNLTNQIKPFSCQLCGTPFGSDKTLKHHLKFKHDIDVSKTRKPKNKEIKIDETKETEIITFD